MTRGRGTASIVASPVLVGAVTTLIVIVSVFLAYNANQGLPFVPTYNLSAELPGGANLVKGNEVRVGGFRIGVIDEIRSSTGVVDGEPRAIAIVDMKLDKIAEPLREGSTFLVRPRSALGLKYIQVIPAKQGRAYPAGSTVPLKFAKAPVEFDDLLNTFDVETRQNSQIALEGYGDAFSGRGLALNEAISDLSVFFRYLTPVMQNLSAPETELDEFFKQIGRASAQAAPVARVQAELFSNMADTFEAIGRNPDALRATIEKSPPTMDVAIRSFRVQRPFLADFADLSRRLRPTGRILPTALPRLNRAFRVGTPVLRQSVALNERTGEVFEALDDLAEDPNTLLALRDLTTTTAVTAPLIGYVSPFQSVCGYATSFFTGLGGHISEGVTNGTAERVLLKSTAGYEQDNRPSDFGDRPIDVPANMDPTGAKALPNNKPLMTFQGTPYSPAIDAQGNADCEVGQWGMPDRLHPSWGRYGPEPIERENPTIEEINEWSSEHAGGSHGQSLSDAPWVAGPSYTGQRAGVRRLEDVP
jgi:ABC-type transporter Mla subunit MlaD